MGKCYHTGSEYRYRMELVRKSDPPDEDREIFAVRSPVSLTAPSITLKDNQLREFRFGSPGCRYVHYLEGSS